MKSAEQPFVTSPFPFPGRVKLSNGATVSVRAKVDGQDYCHKVTLKIDRSGQLAAKVIDPAGDRFDLLFDQTRGTASLIDPLPIPEEWAKVLAKRLASVVVALLAHWSGMMAKKGRVGEADEFALGSA